MEFQSCLNKQEKLKELFLSLPTQEERYSKVIAMGRELLPFPKEHQVKENLVHGCQSILYLSMTLNHDKMKILAGSDALISAGLAALLISIYQDESPEAILKCPPLFIKEIGLLEALSPNRSNGIRSLYQKMQLEAVKLIS